MAAQIKTPHIITLPTVQAEIWYDVCKGLEIYASSHDLVHKQGFKQIYTRCTDDERHVAWELFKEEFERIIN